MVPTAADPPAIPFTDQAAADVAVNCWVRVVVKVARRGLTPNTETVRNAAICITHDPEAGAVPL